MAKSVDYKLGPSTFPRGWFIVAESSELGSEPLSVRFFGEDLALYRGESGSAVLLDAYCPHMGTHLAASTSAHIVKSGQQIEGDSIRCPYHGWRFAPDGQCDDIPYYDGRIPKSAAVRSYPVREVMGCVMAWYDPDGREPDYPAPMLKEWDDPQWVTWELDHLGELDIHPQEVLDNMADARHLGPTHGAPCEYFENEFKDHVYIQRQSGHIELYDSFLRTTTWYTGPGILLSKQSFAGALMYELIANTPVEDGKIKAWHGVLYKGAASPATAEDKEYQKQFQAGALEAFGADFNVWRHKRPAIRVMQVTTDGPFDKGRRWYQQFFDLPEKAGSYHEELNGVHGVDGLPPPDAETTAMGVDLF
jgi:3-ketosteroid 9alpha-monooxygenase subunit A